MKQFTNIEDPKAHEAAKTEEERAEDVAYTINHAISCGVTDIVVQPVASVLATTLVHEDVLPKWMHWITNIFENHEHHSHGHGHDHGSHCGHTDHAHGPDDRTKWQRITARLKSEFQFKKLFGNLGHWAGGEVAGDAGGVIPTIVVQRMAPGFMQGMRNVLEPIAGGFFASGARRDARHWGARHGLGADAPEVQQKEAALYKHEIDHLPQAVVWNVFSIPINFLTQKFMLKHKFTLGEFIIGKTFGTFFSNSVLIGGRGMAPEIFNKWDRWNSEHILRPVLNGPGQLLGIDKKTADRVAGQHEASLDDKPVFTPEASPAEPADPMRATPASEERRGLLLRNRESHAARQRSAEAVSDTPAQLTV